MRRVYTPPLIIAAAGLLGAGLLAAALPGAAVGAPDAAPAGPPREYASYHEFARSVTGGDPERRAGMDTWFFWTAGNEEFWSGHLRVLTRGELDLLKLFDARTLPRRDRFEVLGLVNDPDTTPAEKPDEYGFMLDVPLQPRNQRDQAFGRSTGVIGFRLFPNPRFDPAAWRREGGARRYLSQTSRTFSADLQPPYLVGMTCGACHVGFNPLNPPADPARPAWENLEPTIGNHDFEEKALLMAGVSERDFRKQIGRTQKPGTSDFSFLPNDFINNPNAVNAVFGLGERLRAREYEELTPEQAAFIRGMVHPIPEDLAEPGPQEPPKLRTVRGLMDGRGSVGLPLGTMRGYANMGGIVPEMFLRSLPREGNGYRQQRFDMFAARAHPNGRWEATEKRLPALQQFLTSARRVPLRQAPGGEKYLQDPPETVARGGVVFARNCASCHSSRHPDEGIRDPELRLQAYERLVAAPEFLTRNFLSDDARHPVTELQTNAARALVPNTTRGHIFEQFSSETYKKLPPAGRLWGLENPVERSEPIRFTLPAGGRGYYRTPSLISMWATAPYLHNNSLGIYTRDPGVDARMQAFYDGVQKLLWPETRGGRQSIKRTTADTRLTGPTGEPVMVPLLERGTPVRGADGKPVLQPLIIPAGTPVNLFANLHPSAIPQVVEAYGEGGPAAALARALELNLCPDFVEDRGHYYGAELRDADKWALIAFLKRL